jgi:hypothetical protein
VVWRLCLIHTSFPARQLGTVVWRLCLIHEVKGSIISLTAYFINSPRSDRDRTPVASVRAGSQVAICVTPAGCDARWRMRSPVAAKTRPSGVAYLGATVAPEIAFHAAKPPLNSATDASPSSAKFSRRSGCFRVGQAEIAQARNAPSCSGERLCKSAPLSVRKWIARNAPYFRL